MGNMELAKDNVDNILNAISILRDDRYNFHLYLYGNPNAKDKKVLESIIEQKNLKEYVTFGFAQFTDVPIILSQADILVSSQPVTVRANGGFPTKLGEYLMSGTPVLLTDVGETSQFFKNGVHMYFAEPESPIDFADKLKFIIDNYNIALSVAAKGKKCIEDIISRGKTPIITGGTGLYYRVLLEHYDLPKVEPNYEFRDRAKLEETSELYERLKKLDPASAQRIDSNDKKKIIRALEVMHTTGERMSEVQGQKEAEFDVEWIGVNFPRPELYERINKRVDTMFKNGIIEETEELLNRHGRISNIIYTIGYQEVIGYLDGKFTLEEAKDKLKQNTRNYAKRQLTWFRKNENIKWNHYPEKLNK